MYRRYFKRLLDLLLALPLLVLVSPLLVCTGLGLAVAQRGQVMFRQQRPGLHGKLFTIYKFKTMTDACDANGSLLPDEQRLTPFGKFIRKASLDELPQLFNVLRGELSLVGPRPLLPEYLPLYSPEQARRHLVKPGITGWAQINGRNAISWEKKFSYDCWYVDHLSFRLDCKILFLTLLKVLKREGISGENAATMTKFTGTPTKTTTWEQMK